MSRVTASRVWYGASGAPVPAACGTERSLAMGFPAAFVTLISLVQTPRPVSAVTEVSVTVQSAGCSKEACPLASLNVVQTAGAAGGAVMALGVADGAGGGVLGTGACVAATLPAGSGAGAGGTRFVVTRTPAATAAAASAMTPASRARRRRRTSSRDTMPAAPESLKAAGSLKIRCSAASPSGSGPDP